MKKKKKWLKWVIILAIAAVFAAWLMMFSKGTQSAVYTDVQAVTGDLETYYNFDGLVKAKRTQTITSAQAGTVRTVYVRQNEQVKKGAKLYRLDDGETVQADMAGEVTGLYIEEGSVVSAGETTAQIIDMSSLEVELKVDEYDVAAVTPGMPVQISVLATGGQFTGSVTALDRNGFRRSFLLYGGGRAGERRGRIPRHADQREDSAREGGKCGAAASGRDSV